MNDKRKRPARLSNAALSRYRLRQALAKVTFSASGPRFVCDVFLAGRRIGAYAEDGKGIVTFDRNGLRFGNRKRLLNSAIVAIVQAELDRR